MFEFASFFLNDLWERDRKQINKNSGYYKVVNMLMSLNLTPQKSFETKSSKAVYSHEKSFGELRKLARYS